MIRASRVRAFAIAAVGLAAFLAACATPTTYVPAAADGYGYTDQRLEADRFVVRYKGNSATSAERAQDMALLRAADLTLLEGYEWFQVVGRNVREDTSGSSGSRVGIGVGGSSGSYGSSTGVGVGISLPLGGGAKSGSGAASLEIKMGSGDKPEGAEIYDARSVADSLRSSLTTG